MSSGKKLSRAIGRILYWLSWPGLCVYLPHTNRSRVIVRCGRKTLVVQGWMSDGKWALPGGGRHRHETAKEAALRELKEETGVNLAERDLNLVGSFRYASHGLSFPYELFCAELDDCVALTAQRFEIGKLAWVSNDQLSGQSASADVLAALQYLLSSQGILLQ